MLNACRKHYWGRKATRLAPSLMATAVLGALKINAKPLKLNIRDSLKGPLSTPILYSSVYYISLCMDLNMCDCFEVLNHGGGSRSTPCAHR